MASYKGTTITPGTDAQVAEQVKNIDLGISTTALKDAAPMQVKQPNPATGAAGALGYIGASNDAFTANLQEQSKQRETQSQNSFDAYLEAVKGSEGEIALTDKAYSQSVDPLEAELKDINQQITAEQVSLQRQLEALDKNPGGLFGGALIDEKQRIERDSLRKQADLSVIQMAKQGRFDSAKQIADRAVAAQLEGKRNELQALQLNYERNSDLFDKSEQRTFETMLADRERTFEMEAFKEKSRFEQIIRQSDPLYQAQLQNELLKSTANPNGTLNGKPQTQSQATAQGYATRTNEADQIINRIGAKFTDLGSYAYSIPGFPNTLKSADRQLFEQAQRNFVNAVLRRESGAVISDEEFANARLQYFPQPGDTPETVAQKAQNRFTTINNLYRESNVPRTPMPGDIVQGDDGKQYMLEDDGETLTEI